VEADQKPAMPCNGPDLSTSLRRWKLLVDRMRVRWHVVKVDVKQSAFADDRCPRTSRRRQTLTEPVACSSSRNKEPVASLSRSEVKRVVSSP